MELVRRTDMLLYDPGIGGVGDELCRVEACWRIAFIFSCTNSVTEERSSMPDHKGKQ
jgi:hypothetical protein